MYFHNRRSINTTEVLMILFFKLYKFKLKLSYINIKLYKLLKK